MPRKTGSGMPRVSRNISPARSFYSWVRRCHNRLLRASITPWNHVEPASPPCSTIPQHGVERILRHVAVDDGRAQALEQNETGASRSSLLVHAHQLDEPGCSHAAHRDRQPRALKQRDHAPDIVIAQIAKPARKVGGHYHAGGHCLAVEPRAVALGGLDRVAT